MQCNLPAGCFGLKLSNAAAMGGPLFASLDKVNPSLRDTSLMSQAQQ